MQNVSVRADAELHSIDIHFDDYLYGTLFCHHFSNYLQADIDLKATKGECLMCQLRRLDVPRERPMQFCTAACSPFDWRSQFTLMVFHHRKNEKLLYRILQPFQFNISNAFTASNQNKFKQSEMSIFQFRKSLFVSITQNQLKNKHFDCRPHSKHCSNTLTMTFQAQVDLECWFEFALCLFYLLICVPFRQKK